MKKESDIDLKIKQHIKDLESGKFKRPGSNPSPKNYFRQIKQETKKGFRLPVVIDDWGCEGYYMAAIESEWGTRGLSEQMPSMQIQQGDTIEVLWKDGSVSTEKVVGTNTTNYISEQGSSHPYSVKSVELFVLSSVRGVNVKIPLEELFVRFGK